MDIDLLNDGTETYGAVRPYSREDERRVPVELGMPRVRLTRQEVQDALAGKTSDLKLHVVEIARGDKLPANARVLDDEHFFAEGETCDAIVWKRGKGARPFAG